MIITNLISGLSAATHTPMSDINAYPQVKAFLQTARTLKSHSPAVVALMNRCDVKNPTHDLDSETKLGYEILAAATGMPHTQVESIFFNRILLVEGDRKVLRQVCRDALGGKAFKLIAPLPHNAKAIGAYAIQLLNY